MHRNKAATIGACALGATSVLVGLSAIAMFGIWQRALSGLSADGVIEPISWLMLRIMLVALIAPGVVLLLAGRLESTIGRMRRAAESLSERGFLASVLSVAAVLRLAAVVFIPTRLFVDWMVYDELAWEWAQSGGYSVAGVPTAYYPPGWPFVLSRIYLLFGHAPGAGTLANVVLGVATVYLTYRLVRSIWGTVAARVATLILAILPSQVLFCNLLCSELLFTSLLLLSLWLLVDSRRAGGGVLGTAFLSGMCLGLATLTRGLTLLLPVVIVPILVAPATGRRHAVYRALLLVVGLTLVVGPWIQRNHHVMNRATIATNGGVNLYIGNNPLSRMGYNNPDTTVILLHGPSSEVRDDSVGFALSWQEIAARPLAFAGRGVLKVAFLIISDTEAVTFELQRTAPTGAIDRYVLLAVLAQSLYLVLLLAASVGVWRFTRSPVSRSPGGWLLLSTILYWMAVHFVFFGNGRFHFPIVPLMAGFAALAVVQQRRIGPA